mmetsp:Transcript_26051/g.68447  ORF Transcript_26051/g.68447 Transcript_26051/m.68447 type:complete len:94 (-) Transcript_26051:1129-1410(-)
MCDLPSLSISTCESGANSSNQSWIVQTLFRCWATPREFAQTLTGQCDDGPILRLHQVEGRLAIPCGVLDLRKGRASLKKDTSWAEGRASTERR